MKPYPQWLDEHLPPAGPCLVCENHPDKRHRMVDMIIMRAGAGETCRSIADDYDLPEAFVRRIVAELA